MEFNILANAAIGKGLSGSDRIFIELARNLQIRGHKVVVYTWEDGLQMCLNQKLTNIKFVNWNVGNFAKLGFVISYICRIINSIFRSIFLNLENSSEIIVYSASDFWMDSIPGWILKKRFPKIIWVGTFYLSAPNPFMGFKEKGDLQTPSLKDTIYYFMQKIPYFLIRNYSDLVCLTSNPDIKYFPEHKKSGRFLVIKGGVNLDAVDNKPLEKKYEAVFQGRFHKQKGVLELVDIWEKVVSRLPKAKLAMIGDGPLMSVAKLKVKKEKLEKNVEFFGYLFDGEAKYEIFKQSKIVVHPSLYDSGGMAPAEAMAFGLPGVSFNLKALKSYYPEGMLKAKLGDLEDFASKVIKLLENRKLYKTLSYQAKEMVKSEWGWGKRADQFLTKLNEIRNEKN